MKITVSDRQQRPWEQAAAQAPQDAPADYARGYDIVDEILEEETPQESQAYGLSEVNLRIEKAKLYQTLLSHPLFGHSDEVSQEVEAEIREFVFDRLQVLVGIKEEQKVVHVQQEKIFEDDEVAFLRALAARARTKAPQASPSAPTLNQVSAPVVRPEPTLNQVAIKPQQAPTPVPAPVRKPQQAAQAPVVAKAKVKAPKKQEPPKTLEEAAQQERELPPGAPEVVTAQGQAVSRKHKPLPMPSVQSQNSKTSITANNMANAMTLQSLVEPKS